MNCLNAGDINRLPINAHF